MDKMGPAKYWPDYEGCFHPGVLGGDDSGAMVVMEEFHRVYWAPNWAADFSTGAELAADAPQPEMESASCSPSLFTAINMAR
eukprot:CAMPEP_0181250364 /NCGR_PEP_ID=MMETSP1096-20121128/46278_1 /TAXON_ID=156174 ORGANISM="Chrysochromulina ericina, Strain CCMP281" /NCGR_SAMPLE_ID=MMETSP1096 /ASSEMBLY_ACC=CAM_ASM_000453 /LENGTH=81 /DNA_ID=CAMNT_0023347823 /DNA_START=405 /DNA_END=651 /DNA_ORIENTATION=-